MIYELVGPMGVGKTTVAPLVAEEMGIPYYRGQGFHDLDDKPLNPARIWSDRLMSVLRNPRLAMSSLRLLPGSLPERINFALNICRRDRLEAKANLRGHGVVESGPVHAISQMAAWAQTDLGSMARHITPAAVYVRLSASNQEVTRRLDGRGQLPPEYVAAHGDWIERYDRCVDAMMHHLDRPIVTVDASGEPDEVAINIVEALQSFGPTPPP